MTASVLQPAAAVVGEIAGHSVALRFGGVDAEYAALRRSAILVDRSYRLRMAFDGDRRFDTLTGLVTNDVGSLVAGSGQYAAALTPRGKIIADIRIFSRDADVLVDVPVRAAAGWTAMVRKFVNPRSTRYIDQSAALGQIGVFGPRSREIVAALAGVPADVLAKLAPYAHVTAPREGMLVARIADLGVEGYELFVPAELKPDLWRHAAELGAVPTGLEAWEIARIEAGRPEWGLDIDDSTIPQEANLDELHAISYTKGCYTGQETVARVHFRGHVNRHLRGLTYPGQSALPHGAQLHDDTDKVVGDIRSSAVSPRLGGIALGMVRREVAPGSGVRVRWEGGESMATVIAVPFPD